MQVTLALFAKRIYPLAQCTTVCCLHNTVATLTQWQFVQSAAVFKTEKVNRLYLGKKRKRHELGYFLCSRLLPFNVVASSGQIQIQLQLQLLKHREKEFLLQ